MRFSLNEKESAFRNDYIDSINKLFPDCTIITDHVVSIHDDSTIYLRFYFLVKYKTLNGTEHQQTFTASYPHTYELEEITV